MWGYSRVGGLGRRLIKGGTLVDRAGVRRGDLLIRDERIEAVGPEIDAAGAEVVDAADVVDATGAYVIPGGIDAHTHFDLPVGAVRSADDFGSGTGAAACGGTTCVIDFAGAGRGEPEDALREWHDKAGGNAVVDYGFHLTCTAVPEDPSEARALFAWMASQGVTSVKLYMAYPERLMVDDDTLARAFAAGVAAGVRTCVHAENGREIERLAAEAVARGDVGADAITRVRPPSVEAEAVRRAASLADAAGGAVYVVHLSSGAGLEAVRAAQREGKRVMAETCPQYLFLTSTRLEGPREEAAPFVCAPPLRKDADREALWAGVAEGTVQVVATDHCPFTNADRTRGTVAGQDRWQTFPEIPGGLPGVETRLSLVYQGVGEGRITVECWVDAVAGAPARLFGLDHVKGSLAPGMDADVVVFDPGAHRLLNAARLHMRTDHSPYKGMDVLGWPALVFSRGRLVAKDGEPTDVAHGWGRYVPRRPVR
jgi:dihydropyrimidinase